MLQEDLTLQNEVSLTRSFRATVGEACMFSETWQLGLCTKHLARDFDAQPMQAGSCRSSGQVLCLGVFSQTHQHRCLQSADAKHWFGDGKASLSMPQDVLKSILDNCLA